MNYDFKKSIKDLLIEHKKTKGFLKEEERPLHQSKEDIEKYTPNLKVWSALQDEFLGSLAPSTFLVDKEVAAKTEKSDRCVFWGPLIDLTATAAKNKEGGLFFGGTTDTGKLYTKLQRFIPRKEKPGTFSADYPKGFVPLDRGAFSKNFKYAPGTMASNFGGTSDWTEKQIQQDTKRKDLGVCPPGHKCARKCNKADAVAVRKGLHPDAYQWTAISKADLIGMTGKIEPSTLANIKYPRGTKYATLNFEEAFKGSTRKTNANVLKKAADNTRKMFNKVAFIGVYAPQGGYVRMMGPMKGIRGTDIQFFVADGWAGDRPTGKVYPAYINLLKSGDPIFLVNKKEKFTW